LAFSQVVFKHNFSPSNIEGDIIALKDFQFKAESCQQTTELAFQQVWRVYDIVKTLTLQRRSSVSKVSTISTLIPESSSCRREAIDWLKGQGVASKSHSETPNAATQTGKGVRTGASAEETPTPVSQPIPISRDHELWRNRIRSIFASDRSGGESHDGGDDGSIHSEEKDKSWARGLLGSSKEREREKGAQREVTRMIRGC
jgi:hypothetical protein